MTVFLAYALFSFSCGWLAGYLVNDLRRAHRPSAPPTLLDGDDVTWDIERRHPTYRDPGAVTIRVIDKSGSPASMGTGFRLTTPAADELAAALRGEAETPKPWTPSKHFNGTVGA